MKKNVRTYVRMCLCICKHLLHLTIRTSRFIKHLFSTDIVISLEQSQYSVPNENSSLSVVITMSNVASQDVVVEVSVIDGTAIGKHM